MLIKNENPHICDTGGQSSHYLNIKILAMFSLKLNQYFHPLEIVGQGSEIQFQVGENWNKIT